MIFVVQFCTKKKKLVLRENFKLSRNAKIFASRGLQDPLVRPTALLMPGHITAVD